MNFDVVSDLAVDDEMLILQKVNAARRADDSHSLPELVDFRDELKNLAEKHDVCGRTNVDQALMHLQGLIKEKEGRHSGGWNHSAMDD